MTRPKPFLRLFFGLSGWGAALAAFFIARGLTVRSGASEKAARQSEIELGDAARDSRAGFVVTVVAALAALILGRPAWRDAAEALWMVWYGTRHHTTIADHVTSRARINGLPLWCATWCGPDGAPGVSARRMRPSLPQVGRPVTILIDPGRRRPSKVETDVCIRPRSPH